MEVVGVLLLFSLALFYRETAAASCGTDGPVTLGRDCIEFTLITDYSPPLLNCTYPDLSSLRRSLRLEYRRADNASRWAHITLSNIETVECSSTSCNDTAVVDQIYNITRSYTTMRAYFHQNFQVGNGEGIQLRFIQFKHGGGYCDCWGLACDLLLINSSGNIVKSITPSCLGDDKGEALQCVDSASVERGIVIKFGNDLDPDFSDPSGNGTINNTATHLELECLQEIDVFRAPPVQLTTSVQVNTDCENQSYVEVRFTYDLISLDSFDEGLEMSFSYLNSNRRGAWIPIWYYSSHEPEDKGRSVGHEDTITLGNITDGQITLRGYTVNFTVAENVTDNEAMIRLCGANVFGRDTDDELFKWRFRWLQTAAQDDSNDTDGDVIRIYNIHIQAVLNGTTDSEIPLFDNTTSLSQRRWDKQRNVRFTENETVLEFYSDSQSPNITSREISTVCLAGVTQIHYTLITATTQNSSYNTTCPLQFQYPQLQYQRNNAKWRNLMPHSKNMKVDSNQTESRWKFQVESFVVELQTNMFRECFSDHRIRFNQSEHRGGFCDCWAVVNLTVTLASGQTKTLRKECGNNINLGDLFCLDNETSLDSIAGFCADSASIPREFISRLESKSDETNTDGNQFCNTDDVKDAPTIYCQDSGLRIEVTFDLELKASMCDEIDDFSEGVEFSMKTLSANSMGEWIPLSFISSVSNVKNQSLIKLPNEETIRNTSGTFKLRGYDVPYMIESQNNKTYNVSICGSVISGNNLKVQFRWLHTAYHEQIDTDITDIVTLDNIKIVAQNCTDSVTLFKDDFDNQTILDYSNWDANLTYNVHLFTDADNSTCKHLHGGSAFFSTQTLVTPCTSGSKNNYTITSRQLVTTFTDVTLPIECQSNSNTITVAENDMTNTPQDDSDTTTVAVNEMTNTPQDDSDTTTVAVNEMTNTPQDDSDTTTVAVNEMTDTPQDDSDTTTVAVNEMTDTPQDDSDTTTVAVNEMTDTPQDDSDTTTVAVNEMTNTPQDDSDTTTVAVNEMTDTPQDDSDTTTVAVNEMTNTPQDDSDELIQKLTSFFGSVGEQDNFTSVAFSFRSILREFDEDFEFEPVDSKSIFSNVSQWLDDAKNNFVNGNTVPMDYVTGSTILFVLEDIALNHHPASSLMGVQTDNIVLRVKQIHTNTTDEKFNMSLIEDEDAEIHIPREVISGHGADEQVRVASFLYRNMSGLLPERLGRIEDFMRKKDDADQTIFHLASPVISASLQCDNCTIDNLTDPVEVSFSHTEYDMALLRNDSWNTSVMCVFWEFEPVSLNSSLVSGQWSPFGCNTTFTENSTLCSCNHLTNFAILLSARPLDLSKAQSLSLQITGYIGVIVSLVAMAATIVVFICLKPLRTMRNYIHIQLCVSLGIAQIIFVAGIQPQLGEGQLVPVGCRLVAVLLHYWFLVSFMWMLMEGVVLYVALVRVFVKYHARYIAAFTIASYGLPLLYVGALTVPLGFARTNDYRQNETYDYGYEQACYLNPTTHFIWSIIAPVILIFMANVGFFVMAIVIMYRHQKRQHTEKKSHIVRHWIKATISLTVVMGITWIIGILVIEVKALFALAYIFTIFVAFQGLFIFVIFVLLSKQVRENYAKWWKAKVAESDFLSKHFGTNIFNLGTELSGQHRPKKINSIDKSASNIMSSKEKHRSNTMELGGNYSHCVQGSLSYSGANGFEKETDDKVQCNKTTDPSPYDVTYIPSSPLAT